MNIFRRNNNEELENKIKSYETLFSDFQSQLESQSLKINELTDKVQELSTEIQIKEDVIKEKEEIIVEKEDVIEELTVSVQEKESVIEEVIENTMSVEKLASIKALEILADSGTPVVETIDSPEEVDLMAQMRKLSGKSLMEFYNANRKQIFDKLKQE